MSTTVFEGIKLEGRQLVDVPPTLHPLHRFGMVRYLGVALDNEEAEMYLDMGFRVFGDDQGPFLVVRIPDSVQGMPCFLNPNNVDITFLPKRWSLREGSQSGIICWLKNWLG